jgi:hypothetical protein
MYQQNVRYALARAFLDIDDENANLLDGIVESKLNSAQNRRYLFRGRQRRSGIHECLFLCGLTEDSTEIPWLNDVEFISEFRVSRTSFVALHDMIKDHPIFKSGRRGPKQAPSEFQLLVLLRFLGMDGNGNGGPKMRSFFRIGKGTVQVYRDRAMKAIRSLRDVVDTWPNELERERISKRMYKEFGWKNCVFIADGTLFPLGERPQVEDWADYHGRKYGYSLNAMILSDDKRRIRAYLAGNPGTCHDQRSARQMTLWKTPDKFLSPKQYGIGDSAFDNQWFMVSAYKKPVGTSMPREYEVFNDKMKKPRVISEHVNGILKGRFPLLNKIPFTINGKKTMKYALKYIDCCVILHNLLVGLKDDIPDEWRDDVSDISELDEAPADAELDAAIPEFAPNDARRIQLMHYFNESTI